jgi:dihydroflavonol-4-reductase
MNSKVLITGATGFLGTHLLNNLIEQGFNIRCFVRNTSTLSIENERVEVFKGDILNPSHCFEVLKGIDVIYHVAGLGLSKIKGDPTFNETSTKVLLEAAVQHEKEFMFIYVSSIKSVGPNQSGLLTEVQNYKPTDLYGMSKEKAEKEILKIKNNKIKTVIVRPPAIYGPGDHNFLPIFKLMHKGIQIKLVGGILNKFSMVYVNDLVDCLVTLPKCIKNSDILIISHKDIINFNEFFSFAPIISKRKTKKVYIPIKATYSFLRVVAKILNMFNKSNILPLSRVNDLLIYNWSVNTSKASIKYGLNCETPLKDGIIETYNWYLQNGWLDKK